jgi:hypothetical protein
LEIKKLKFNKKKEKEKYVEWIGGEIFGGKDMI